MKSVGVATGPAPLPYKRGGDPALLPYDPIFFRKVDIKVGTTLLCMGRTTSGTHWSVIEILSDQGYGRGVGNVDVVQKLNDRVRLKRLDLYEHRTVAFKYISYSAIWRLAE